MRSSDFVSKSLYVSITKLIKLVKKHTEIVPLLMKVLELTSKEAIFFNWVL